MDEAEKSWHKRRGAKRITSLLNSVPFKDGIPAPDNPPEQQKLAALCPALGQPYTTFDISSD